MSWFISRNIVGPSFNKFVQGLMIANWCDKLEYTFISDEPEVDKLIREIEAEVDRVNREFDRGTKLKVRQSRAFGQRVVDILTDTRGRGSLVASITINRFKNYRGSTANPES